MWLALLSVPLLCSVLVWETAKRPNFLPRAGGTPGLAAALKSAHLLTYRLLYPVALACLVPRVPTALSRAGAASALGYLFNTVARTAVVDFGQRELAWVISVWPTPLATTMTCTLHALGLTLFWMLLIPTAVSVGAS